MYAALLEKSLRSIDAVRRHIRFSSALRDLISAQNFSCKSSLVPCFDTNGLQTTAPAATDWKVIDHCSAVTRTYASFERFVHEILASYLGFLEQNFSYGSLDKKLRDEHRRRLGEVLSDLDKDRYKALSLEAIVRDFYQAVAVGSNYRILPEAILDHDQNLRMSELSSIYGRCGIADLKDWVSNHRVMKKFFSDQSRQSDTAEAELTQLIQYRNEAAHGGTDVDSVVGAEILEEYTDFVSALCVALTECVQHAVLGLAKALGKAHLSGSITEKYSDNRVVAIVGKQKFKTGDLVYLAGDAYCFSVNIESIMENNELRETLTVLENKEIGFKFNIEPIKRAEIYYFIE